MTHIPPHEQPVAASARAAVRPSLTTMILAVMIACVIGFLGGGLLGALGLGTSVPAPRPPVPAPVPSPAPDPESDDAPAATISLQTDRTRAAPNERIMLSGRLTPAQEGVALAVQRGQDGGPFQSFPVSTTTDAQGRFATQVATRQRGENRFRVVGEVDGQQLASEPVVIQVG